MSNVALIVRRELSAYGRTLSGYVIATVMLLWLGLMFHAWALDAPRPSTEVLLRYFEIAGGTVLVMAAILSMRLLAEDRSTGTQTLLFTSPVREGEVVLGKYLAALAFLVIFLALSLYLPALVFLLGKVSWGHIAAGYLGMFLLGASTLAVGMFASSLVKHPFLAVLLALFFAALLEATWWVARISEGGFTDLLAYFAPYYNHFQPFRRGLLQLSDVVFFLSLTYIALLASTRVLKSQRWR